ncbi:MAG: hypothetical protein IKA87_00155 [Lentisphaeria bacterium]|nr:hypothetical protein [Lentisphaeria bacterium]
MRITVSVKGILFFLILSMLLCGCTKVNSVFSTALEDTQYAVRQRMLKLQTGELLFKTADERYTPKLANKVITLSSGYQDQTWNVENDPALEVLENALVYALVVLSPDPAAAAEKLSGAMLDYGSASRVLKLQKNRFKNSSDVVAELVMMTGWSNEKVKKYASASLPEVKIDIFPLYPEAEHLLNEKGHAAAFQTAAELYRMPSDSTVRKAEQLRRAILNRYLMQIKSSGSKIAPELRIAYWRGQIFAPFLPLI